MALYKAESEGEFFNDNDITNVEVFEKKRVNKDVDKKMIKRAKSEWWNKD